MKTKKPAGDSKIIRLDHDSSPASQTGMAARSSGDDEVRSGPSSPTLMVEAHQGMRKPISVSSSDSPDASELRFVTVQSPSGERDIRAFADSKYGESGTETKIAPTAERIKEHVLNILPAKQRMLDAGLTLTRKWVRDNDPYIYERFGDVHLDALIADWENGPMPWEKNKRAVVFWERGKQKRGIVSELVTRALVSALPEYTRESIERWVRGSTHKK